MKKNINLYIDFGSAFTKVTAIDIEKEEILGYAQSSSTHETDISEGFENALNELNLKIGNTEYGEKFACSSIDNGLRMIIVGLVPHLSSDAAKKVALGAGVNVIETFSGKLSDNDIANINELDVDMILLCGGTDGGNKDNVIHNSNKLISVSREITVIYAGNKDAAYDCRKILEKDFKDFRISENVMSQHNILNVEPVRKTIKEAFVERIYKSEKFSKLQRQISGIVMPTSYSILNAATLLSQGTNNVEGMGELMVVDCGGFKTDVFSIASGCSTKPDTIQEGISEPYEKRTLENFGTRHNIDKLIEAYGIDNIKKELKKSEQSVKEFEENIMILKTTPDFVPINEEQLNIDSVLCKAALEIGVYNHVGTLEKNLHIGKDLTNLQTVIGIGGPIVQSNNPKNILEGTVLKTNKSHKLKPKESKFYIYNQNIMYALGILGETEADKSTRMLKKYLAKL